VAAAAPAAAPAGPAQPPAPVLTTWLLALLALPLLPAAVAAGMQWRRRMLPMVEEDAPEFAAALALWAPVAFRASPSPRELKRFMNRLRFAATADDVPANTATVTLAAFAHADRSLVEEAAAGRADLRALVRERLERPQDDAPLAEFYAAMGELKDPETAFSGFPPTREAMQRFLAAWTGVTVRG
jgi:hypothetical protein